MANKKVSKTRRYNITASWSPIPPYRVQLYLAGAGHHDPGSIGYVRFIHVLPIHYYCPSSSFVPRSKVQSWQTDSIVI